MNIISRSIRLQLQQERATNEMPPVLFITDVTNPGLDSITAFRKHFPGELSESFVMLLRIAYDMDITYWRKLMDGVKIRVNASKQKATSMEYAGKLEEHLHAQS